MTILTVRVSLRHPNPNANPNPYPNQADASLRGAGGGACARCLYAAGARSGGEGGGAVRLLVGAMLSESNPDPNP